MEAVAPNRQLAGRYRLQEQIGAGGMATVWRADDSVLARPVAVKILHEHLSESGDLLERFRREAVAAARLAHPHLVRVYDAGTDEGCAFIVTELVPGRTLADVIRDGGAMEPAAAADVTMAVLSALECAHAAGIVHRDVKPGNILIAPDGLVKVTDFGLAPAFDATDLETTGEMLGTVAYVAPEQVQGGDVTPATDVYAAGLVLYELLTGRRAFRGETDLATALARLTTRPPAPSAMRPGIPRGLDQVVERATALRPEQRYSSAASMRAALERFGGSTDAPLMPAPEPADHATPPSAAPGRGSLRGWMVLPVAVVLIAAAVIAGGLALGRLSLGGPLGIRAAEPTASAPPGPQLRDVPIVAARDEDPLGSDHRENPGTVALAIDGDPNTAWSTEHYASAGFGNLKTGVGLWLDFGSSSDVRSLTIATLHPGWTFQLYSDPNAQGSPLAATDGHASTFTAKEGETTISLEPSRARGILIWVTGLVPDGDGFSATVADVSVRGAG
jgi:serine/threonine-protein kinase